MLLVIILVKLVLNQDSLQSVGFICIAGLNNGSRFSLGFV